ncbi:MAG: alpha/beta fold hydrolase [Devosiaceae bacterium]|nr:alpha/beta fold hydrolase [Devosiaceae bacterium]
MLLGLDRPDVAEQVHIFNFNLSPSTATGKNKTQLFLAKSMRFARNQPALLCLYAIGLDWDKGVEILLIDAFALSASELQIGRGLCEGKSLNDIANERNRSVHTIRTQVKSMLHKTGTSSQADLVRIMATLTAFGRRQKFKLARILNLHETSERIMIPLEGDRNMPVYQVGAPDGRPVLFIHGMIDGYDACKFAGKLLAKNNIKLIAPVRPSFSDSPPAYEIKTAPEEFAADLHHIMDYLEIDSAPIIGHMAGSLYAFAAASILQERILAILNISGVTPIKSFREILSMSPRQRVVAWTARFTPNLLPTILRAGISQIDRGLEVEFMNALYAKGSKDREVAQNIDVSAAIHAGYQFVIAQGHRAFEVDSHHVTRDWSSYLERVHQRVVLAHGTLDQTIKIKTVREFANLYENIELIEHEDAGQLVFYQKPDAIISILNTLFD